MLLHVFFVTYSLLILILLNIFLFFTRVMKEYKIRFTNEKLSLFKTNKQISFITKKLNYLKATLEHIPAHFSLVKERTMNYVSKIHSYGAKIEKTYVGRILHSKCEIIISEVDAIYRFENIFTDKKYTKFTGDFTKKITKEEFEHRRKNINYILKKIDTEEEKKMKYISDEEVTFTDEPSCEKNEVTQTSDDHKIRRCIKEAKIVNYKTLCEIFPLANNIIDILSEMCYKLNGRFVLKNKFYIGSLKKLRETIFKEFINNDIVLYNTNTADEKFLLEEISIFKDNAYYLKGFYEEIQLQKSNIDIEKIIFDEGIVSMNRMKELVELDEEILTYLENHSDIVKLQNNGYVIKHTKNDKDPRNIVIELLMTRSNIKRNDVFAAVLEKTGKELNIFVYNKIMKEFCTAKGNNWMLRK